MLSSNDNKARSTGPVTNLNEDFRLRTVETLQRGFTVDPAPAADIPGSVVRDGRFQRRDVDAERGRIVAEDHSDPSLLIIALVQAA